MYIIREKDIGIGIERKEIGIGIDFWLGKGIGIGIDFPTKQELEHIERN